jgi:hypothetical protein
VCSGNADELEGFWVLVWLEFGGGSFGWKWGKVGGERLEEKWWRRQIRGERSEEKIRGVNSKLRLKLSSLDAKLSSFDSESERFYDVLACGCQQQSLIGRLKAKY